MYKTIIILLCFAFSIGSISSCFANDIPEQMLYNKNSRVYFGEVKTFDKSSVTIIQKQNIKGDFVENRAMKYDFYDKYTAGAEIEIGRTYLCGDTVIDTDEDIRGVHIFAVTTLDTATMEFEQGCDVTDTLQDYFNKGLFEQMNKKIRQEQAESNHIELKNEDIDKDTENLNLHIKEILLCAIFICFIRFWRK